MTAPTSRRDLLRLWLTGAVGAIGMPLLAACGGSVAPASGPAASTGTAAASSSSTPSASGTAFSATQVVVSSQTSTAAATPVSATTTIGTGAAVKLVYWAFGGGDPLGDKLFRIPADTYTKEHAGNVAVEYTSIPSGQIQEKVLTSWVSGTGPDVVFDSSRGFLRFMDSDVYLDVTADFGQRKLQASDWYQTSLKFYQVAGRQLGMPQGFGTSVYGLNLDLFHKSGIALAPGFDANWSQNDLLQMLKQVVKYDPDGKMNPGGADDPIFENWLWNYGSGLVAADLVTSPADNDGGLAAAEWYQRVHTGERLFMRPAIDYAKNVSFINGNVAIAGNAGPFVLDGWRTLKFAANVFLRPKGPADHYTRMYIDGFTIWKQARVRDVAVDFLFYLTNQGCAEMERGGGYNIPSYRPVVEQVFLPNPANLDKQKWLTAAEHAQTDPRHPKWIPDISTIYDKYTGALRSGKSAPRDAMQAMANEIRVVLQNYAKTPGFKRLVS